MWWTVCEMRGEGGVEDVSRMTMFLTRPAAALTWVRTDHHLLIVISGLNECLLLLKSIKSDFTTCSNVHAAMNVKTNLAIVILVTVVMIKDETVVSVRPE